MIPIGKTAFIGFIVAAATCLGMSASGSEKNGKTLTAVESLMRSDTRIMELDGMLNHSYRAAMRAVAYRKTLKQEQIAWLRTVRNPCKTTDCLEDVYCDRINELHDLEIEALNVIEKPLTDDEARDICRSMAKLADNGKLSLMAVPGKSFSQLDDADKGAGWALNPLEMEQVVSLIEYDGRYASNKPLNVFKLRLNPASEPVLFGEFTTSGTCPSGVVHNLSMFVSSDDAGETDDQANQTGELTGLDNRDTIELYDDDGVEDVGSWTWGHRDYPVVYHGRHYLVTTGRHLSKVAWITPGGKFRDLALYSTWEAYGSYCSEPNDRPTERIINGSIRPLTFKDYPACLKLVEKKDERLLTAHLLKADVNRDGIEDNIVKFEYHPDPGCWHKESWFQVLSNDLKRIEKNALSKLLAQYSITDFYHNKGKYYFSSSGKYSGIFRFDKGKISRVGTTTYSTSTDMVRYAPFNPRTKD